MKTLISNWKKVVSVLLIAVMFSINPLSDAAPKGAQAKKTKEEQTVTVTENTLDNTSDNTAVNDINLKEEEAPSERLYVSELRLFKGEEDCKKGESEGWIIVKNDETFSNLNEVTTEGSPAVYLGYKTTTNEDEAIRDIKMLEMDREYKWFDYQKVAEGQMAKLEPMVADIATAAVEFKDNLAGGSKAAAKAKAYLNLLYFTKDYPNGDKVTSEKIYLGDYLASGEVDQQLLKKLIVRMNGGSLLAIYSQLVLGLTDTGKNWAERISEAKTLSEEKASATQKRIWDRSYYEYSMDLLPKLKSFAENYAKIGKASASGSAADILKDSGDELTSDNVQDVLKAGSASEAADIAYQTAYEKLNKYSVGSEKLGDYILRLGTKDYSTRQDYREMYPLVEALTNGQYGMCKLVGIEQFALYLDNTDETYAKMDEERDKLEKTISNVTKGEKTISVWVGVNTEFYDRPVALTSDAYRESKAGLDYTELTREGEFYDQMNLIMMGIGIASSVCAVISGAIQLGLLISGSSLGVWAACTAMIGTGFWATALGILGAAVTVLGSAALIALLVCLIVFVVYKIAEYVHRDDKGDYTEMPKEIYDIVEITKNNVKQRAFTKYVPVTNGSGAPQDLNGDDGKRWNLLYYTKNKGYGAPLCVDNEGKAFIRVMDRPETPEGTVPVSCFGEGSAANLNSFVRKGDSRNIYLYYITTASLDGTDGSVKDGDDINDGDDAKVDGKDNINKKKFLYSLIISKESTESAAKTGIRRKPGFQVLDYNLTPNQDGVYTYIGFSLTSVEKDAIRDIRIVPNYTQDVSYGPANYTSAGTLEDGSAIVYTRHKDMGSPIYGGLAIRDKILPAEDPLEPINMFCGGNAFNLGMQKGGKPVYLYFLPSKSFTSGEKYISGIQVVAARKTKETRGRDELLNELGLTDLGGELASYRVAPQKDVLSLDTEGMRYGGLAPYHTHNYEDYTAQFAYSLTYNPYRAIYDVGIYRATTRIDKLLPMIGSTEGVYACAETVMISDKTELYSESNYHRGEDVKISKNSNYYGTKEAVRVLPHHSWINPPHFTGRGYYQSLNPEGNINMLKLEKMDYRLIGLYMIGPGGNRKNPLKEGDLVVSSLKDAPAGMRPAKLFTDPYSDKPTNLGYETTGVKQTPAYMYIRGEKQQKPKYISSVDIVTYKKPEAPKADMSDDEKKQYEAQVKYADNYSDDSCRMGLISKVSGQIYNYNISADQSKVWYNYKYAGTKDASYIGVNRTDDSNKAITGIIWYKTDKAPHLIKVGGVDYRRTGEPVKGYYLYYTKSPAANPGVPLTDIIFDHNVINKGQANIITLRIPDSDDGKTKADFLYQPDGITMNMHMALDTSDAIISGISVIQGGRDRSAVELTKSGYNYIIDADFNYNAGGGSVFIGYKMCGASAIKKSTNTSTNTAAVDDTDDEDLSDFNFDFSDVMTNEKVIYDIVCVKGGGVEETIKHNGATYHIVSPISLNDGTDGTRLVIYAAYEDTFEINGVKTVLSPLSGMYVCSHDAVPGMGDLKNPYGNWELFLDTEGDEVNLNDGVISTDDKGHIRDCRLFMFLHRYESHIKPGAQIERGKYKGEIATAFDEEIVGGLYLVE